MTVPSGNTEILGKLFHMSKILFRLLNVSPNCLNVMYYLIIGIDIISRA